MVKSGSLSHRKNTKVIDVSIFALYCYFIKEAPQSFRKNLIISTQFKFPNAF